MTDEPRGWNRALLGDVAEWGSGGTPKAGTPEYYGGSIPWAVIGDLNDSHFASTASSITERGLLESSAKLVPDGSVLIAMYGSIGKLGLPEIPMATNQAIAFAKPHTGVLDRRYLFWYLMSQREALARSGKGATQQNISQTILKAWPIAYPQLDEQRRIVTILEDHLSRVEEGERALARAESLALTAWNSFLAQALTRMREGGTTRPLGEVATTRLGKMLDAKRNAGVRTPYLRNQNVQWRTIDFEDVMDVPLSSSEISDLAVRPGDLLVCEGGEPGRCAVVESSPSHPVAFQKALHRVRVHDGISPQYLQLIIEALARLGRLESLFTGTTIKHFPQERLRALSIPVPDVGLQSSLVEEATTMRASLDRLSMETGLSRSRSQALRRSLLASAFSGQLVRGASLV